MGTTGGSTSTAAGAPTPAGVSAPDLEALSASARGWHRIQLAVLGFIGFCGILWEGDPANPAAVQYAGLVLIATAFVLAVVSILLVGRVAHPVGGPTAEAAAATAAHRTRRLRRGIWGTYLAVALLVIATLSSWLPSGAAAGEGAAGGALAGGGAGAVVVVAVDTRTWCGDLVEAAEGVVRLRTTEGMVQLPGDQVARLHPVEAC